jgi:outer membrane receptor protein involved in Fe transport
MTLVHPRHRIALVSAGLALALTLHSGPAHADARTEARRHFKIGMELIGKKRYPDGIRELEKAYEILPHPNVAFNIAQAQAEAGNLDLALRAYKTYLKSDPPDRAEVATAVQQLEEKLAAQKVGAAPSPAMPAPAPEPSIETPPTTGTLPAAPSGERSAEPVQETTKPLTDTTKPASGHEPDKAASGATTPPASRTTAADRDRADTKRIVGAARTEDIYRETVVTASRNAQSPLDAPNSTSIITRQDILLSGITRIPELLRRVAGVDVMQITGGDENVSLRGFNSRLANKVLVLVNGRSVYNDILGSTFWESFSIDVDQIERIEVVRGPGSALYGADAFNGVINIITIAPGEGKNGIRVGYGDSNQSYGSGWVSGREGDFAYRASAGYTRYPRWTRETAPGRIDITRSDFDQNLGAENLRFDLRTSQRIGKDMELAVGGGYARAALNVYGIGPFNDYRLQGDAGDVTLDFRSRHFNARTYFYRLAVRAGADYAYRGQTLYESHPTQNVYNAELEYVDDFRLPKAVRHDIHLGVGYRLKNVLWEYLERDLPIEHHASAYAQDSVAFSKHVALVASGRLDYVPYLRRPIPSGRASLLVKPTDRQAIRLSGSSAFRATTYLESYLSLPIQLTIPGVELVSASRRPDDNNYRVRPEQISTIEASYLNQQNDFFEIEFNAYYNRVTNLIALSVNRPVSLTDKAQGLGGYDDATSRFVAGFGGWDNQCDIYNVLGGEIAVRAYPVEGLDFFANYALNASLQSRPAGCAVAEGLKDDQRTSVSKLNAGVQLRTKAGINGEISFHYQSSQSWNEQVATPAGIFYKTFPLPAYSLFNARVGYRFHKDRAEISGTVFNALEGVFAEAPQMHPFGNRVGRRLMGFFSYSL